MHAFLTSTQSSYFFGPRPLVRRTSLFIAIWLLIALFSPFLNSISAQQTPTTGFTRQLNYTGRLKDAADQPISAASIDLVFSFYDGPNAATANQIWTESYTAVPVKKGYFNVKLGSQTPFPASLDFSQQYYLGIKVNSDPEMTPLVPFTPAPYAFYAGLSGDLTPDVWQKINDIATISAYMSSIDYLKQGTANGQLLFWNSYTHKWEPSSNLLLTNGQFTVDTKMVAKGDLRVEGDNLNAVNGSFSGSLKAEKLSVNTIKIDGLSPLRLVSTNANGDLVSLVNLSSYLTTRTPSQLLVSDNGKGGVILDINLAASATYAAAVAGQVNQDLSTISGKLSNHENRITNLETKTTSLSQQQSTLNNQVSQNNSSINQLKNQMITTQHNDATLAAQLRSLGLSASDLQKQIWNNDLDLATIAATLTEIGVVDLATLSAQVRQNQVNIAALSTSVSQQQTQLANLDSRLTTAESSLINTRQRLALNETKTQINAQNIATNSAAIQNLFDLYHQAYFDVATVTAQVALNTFDINHLKNTDATLAAQMTNLQRRISFNAQDIATNSAAIAALEWTIANALDLSLPQDLYATSSPTFNNLFLTGKLTGQGLTINGASLLNGQLTVKDILQVDKNAFLKANVDISGRLFVQQNASLAGQLWVSDQTRLQQDLFVGSDVQIGRDLSVARDASVAGQLFGSNASFSGNLQASTVSAQTGAFVGLLDSYGHLGQNGQILAIDENGGLLWRHPSSADEGLTIADNGTLLQKRSILDIIGESYTLLDDPNHNRTILNITEKGKIGNYEADTINVDDGQVMVFDSASQKFVPMYLGVINPANQCSVQHDFYGVTAGTKKPILVNHDSQHNRPSVEVLKRVQTGTAVTTQMRNYTSSDQTKYVYNNKYVAFDSAMHPVNDYTKAATKLNQLGIIGDTNEEINLFEVGLTPSEFKRLSSINVDTINSGSLDQTGGLYGLLKTNQYPDGVTTLTLNNGEQITAQIINYYDNVIYTVDPVVGNTTADTQMLVLYYHQNLTIYPGVTITPSVRKKGLVIIVDGVLHNEGKISMTARGAAAVGQDVLLYKNRNLSYEYVPKAGATGIARKAYSFTAITEIQPVKGNNGVNRQTGSGATGSGGMWYGKGTVTVGASGNGTSYSGGAGSGGCSIDSDGVNIACDDATLYTGAAGKMSIAYTNTSGFSTGGVGITSGANSYVRTAAPPAQNTGTGGLLIVYASVLDNLATIEANGVGIRAVSVNSSSGISHFIPTPGGPSGGGSNNVFYKQLSNLGAITASGGAPATIRINDSAGNNKNSRTSQSGGNGSVTKTDISFNYYLFSTDQGLKYFDFSSQTFLPLPTGHDESQLDLNDFQTYGDINPIDIGEGPLATLGSEFKIMVASSKPNLNIAYKAIPQPQLIIDRYDFDAGVMSEVTSATIDAVETGNSKVRFVFSTDKGATWLTTTDLTTFNSLPNLDVTTVLSSGMDILTMKQVLMEMLDLPGITDQNQNIRLAYAIDQDNINNQVSLTDIKLVYVTVPEWYKAVHKTEYDYVYKSPQTLEVTFNLAGDYKVNVIGDKCESQTQLPEGTAVGQVLTWNGSEWIAASPSAGVMFSPLQASSSTLAALDNLENQLSSLEQAFAFETGLSSGQSLVLSQLIDFSDTGSLIFSGSAEFLQSVKFKHDVSFEGQVQFAQDLAGILTIGPGTASSTHIFQPAFDDQPVVVVSPFGKYRPAFFVSDISRESFTVQLDQSNSSTQTATFNWIVQPHKKLPD